jgi:hypothetical protein
MKPLNLMTKPNLIWTDLQAPVPHLPYQHYLTNTPLGTIAIAYIQDRLEVGIVSPEQLVNPNGYSAEPDCFIEKIGYRYNLDFAKEYVVDYLEGTLSQLKVLFGEPQLKVPSLPLDFIEELGSTCLTLKFIEGDLIDKDIRNFYMSQNLITEAQYKEIMGCCPDCPETNLPMTEITWYQAQTFCVKLSKLTNRRYTLPTVKQWEYACLANSPWIGLDEAQLQAQAWYRSENVCGANPQPVGTKQPNPWGLHDMLGNVWEWCEDLVKRKKHEHRQLRGGDCLCRLADFAEEIPKSTEQAQMPSYNVGFRVVCDAKWESF